jgi:DNA-binding MarR family transcriptional regulator
MKKRAHKLTFKQRYGIEPQVVRRLWVEEFEPRLGPSSARVLIAWARRPHATAKIIGDELGLSINAVAAIARSTRRRLDDMNRRSMRQQTHKPALRKMELLGADPQLIQRVADQITPRQLDYLAAAIEQPEAKTCDIAKFLQVNPTTASHMIQKIVPVVRRVKATPCAKEDASYA